MGTELDYYLWGREQHQLTANVIKGVYMSVRLAMCTITGSRLGQQQQQRLPWSIAEIEVGEIVVGLGGGREAADCGTRRVPLRVRGVGHRCA